MKKKIVIAGGTGFIGIYLQHKFEEMGFETPLKELFHFIYKAPFDNGLTEHELDHVMIGTYSQAPKVNPEEVESWKWMSIDDIKIASQNLLKTILCFFC